MKIAAAQISAKVGAIPTNLATHYQMIAQAAEQEVDLIVFPEMSLSGYCREEARDLAFSISDERLFPLQQLADQHTICIIAGAPIAIEDKLYIGSFVISPKAPLQIYTKQYLHQGEEVFFDYSFDYNPILKLGEERISLAICADIDNPAHPAAAKQNATSLYLPSIFFSEGGIDGGHELLATYAKQNKFSVLMSNYCGEHWDTKSGGKSAFWDQNGQLLALLEPEKSGLLIAQRKGGRWQTQVLAGNQIPRLSSS